MEHLFLEDRHKKIVQDLLKKYNYTFFAFGSRVKGNHHKFSDLDLFYKDNIPEKIITQLKEEFEESDLPFTVDLVNYHACDDAFQACILKNCICIQVSKTF